jgi:uncharacterized membrane protein YkvI
MSGRKGTVFRVAATYVGTVVGAGFASGQETLRFFAAYGRVGLWGVGLATILFCALGILVMDLGARLNARSHREVLLLVLGRRVGTIMDGLITLFLGATLTVMVAGGGAVFAEQFGLSRGVGVLITSAAAGLTILAGMRGIMAANAVVVPLLTLGVTALTFGEIRFHTVSIIWSKATPHLQFAPVGPWWLAAILYVGYNLVLAISVLAPLGATVQDRRSLWIGGLVGGLALGALAGAIQLALSAHLPEIGRWEVPMLFLARLQPGLVQWGYAVILWAEIYTTAISCAYGFVARVTEVTALPYRWGVVGATCLALVGSGLGFSTLLGTLYPLFGFTALAVLVGLGFLPIREWWHAA